MRATGDGGEVKAQPAAGIAVNMAEWIATFVTMSKTSYRLSNRTGER